MKDSNASIRRFLKACRLDIGGSHAAGMDILLATPILSGISIKLWLD